MFIICNFVKVFTSSVTSSNMLWQFYRFKIFFLAFVLNHFWRGQKYKNFDIPHKRKSHEVKLLRGNFIIIILNYYKLHISKDVAIKSPKTFHKMIFFNRDIIFCCIYSLITAFQNQVGLWNPLYLYFGQQRRSRTTKLKF